MKCFFGQFLFASWIPFCVMDSFLCHGFFFASWIPFCVMDSFLCHGFLFASWILFCVIGKAESLPSIAQGNALRMNNPTLS
jgi:hypothetical protein